MQHCNKYFITLIQYSVVYRYASLKYINWNWVTSTIPTLILNSLWQQQQANCQWHHSVCSPIHHPSKNGMTMNLHELTRSWNTNIMEICTMRTYLFRLLGQVNFETLIMRRATTGREKNENELDKPEQVIEKPLNSLGSLSSFIRKGKELHTYSSSTERVDPIPNQVSLPICNILKCIIWKTLKWLLPWVIFR